MAWQRPKFRRGFTLLELLTVMAIIAIISTLILSAASKTKAKAKRAQCLNNLKQAGLAFHSFAHDHADKFPMQVSTNSGGTLEFVRAGNLLGGAFYFAFCHVQALSNELGDPRLLICAADIRSSAENFAVLKNDNVSYFIGVSADYARPDSILGGDRNITNPNFGSGSLLFASSTDALEWTRELHEFRGNILFSDSHVELFNNAGLATTIAASTGQRNSFWPPVVAPNPVGTGTASPDTFAVPPNARLPRSRETFLAKQVAAAAAGPTVNSERRRSVGADLSVAEPIPLRTGSVRKTNSVAQVGLTNAGAGTGTWPLATEPETTNKLAALFGKVIGGAGFKWAYLLLLLIVLLFVMFEVLRRRMAKRRLE